ncbi:MAG TPA: endolytic transglycosylase MltG [Vicinamibacteria bacterium]|nr:endolytic transglycosylase MltG [Vicinamibacteria bacterium]
MRRLLFLALLAAVLYGAWWYETRRPFRAASEPPRRVLIPPGTGVRQIGRQLQGQGLVRHPEIFRLLVLERGGAGKLQAGEYELSGRMSLRDLVDKMARGDVVRRFVTFPEGRNLEEMAAILAARGVPPEAFLAVARDPAPIADLDPEATDLEGYLFPDTYEIPPRPDAAAAVARQAVSHFKKVIAPERPAVAQSGRSLREVVTLASLVELETAVPAERPRVAAVFLNRLRRRMPLQTDPTVIFAMRKAGRWDGNIRKGDLAIDSPYNTYRYPGLPPGPIASPGIESIRAVLRPAVSDELYFVSRNDGSHYFSRTLAEHSRAVDHYQRGRGLPPPDVPASPGASPSVPAASPSPDAPSR